jgi:hypothetical protein
VANDNGCPKKSAIGNCRRPAAKVASIPAQSDLIYYAGPVEIRKESGFEEQLDFPKWIFFQERPVCQQLFLFEATPLTPPITFPGGSARPAYCLHVEFLSSIVPAKSTIFPRSIPGSLRDWPICREDGSPLAGVTQGFWYPSGVLPAPAGGALLPGLSCQLPHGRWHRGCILRPPPPPRCPRQFTGSRPAL